MADIKTYLRELGVAVSIASKLTNQPISEATIKPKEFFDIATSKINNDISFAEEIVLLDEFDEELKSILKNSFELGRYIYEKFNFDPKDEIIWCGNDTQSDNPADLKIGTHSFSLKEDSFILENMGLYKLLELLTSKTFPRGTHVFKQFAQQEYEKWFQYSWDQLINETSWSNEHGGIIIDKENINFICGKTTKILIPKSTLSFDHYMSRTNTFVREKLVAKWIKDKLNNNDTYIKLKKECAETAGKNICLFIHNNKDIKLDDLMRLLQIREYEYYYAKSTTEELTLLKVPCSQCFDQEIQIQSVEYSVPSSQLNLITTIKNIKTNKIFTIRNECRFSHGQFNGTPEAKMYYDKNSDLRIIYTEV